MLDLATGRWRQVADAPVGVRHAPTTVVGDDVYALSQCDPTPTCPAGWAMLRYRSVDDQWDLILAPFESGFFTLVRFAGDVVALADTDERGEGYDFRFDVDTGRWTALPDDPLPLVYDRQAVEHEGRLMVFGTPLDGSATKLAVAFDEDTGAWTSLPESSARGFQVWRSDDRLYLNSHFGPNAHGGVFDPATGRWSALPAAPGAPSWRGDMAGVVGKRYATFAYPTGWVLDTASQQWVEIPPRPAADVSYDEMVGAVGTTLVVFGGQRWRDSDVELLNETWTWTMR